MKAIQQIKIFISCPSDIIDELNSIEIVVQEINKTSGKQNGYSLELLNWETDTYTQIGDDPQDVINTQIESEYDILVGLLWQKVGTPTKRDKSGTIEEINRAIENKEKEQLIYFKTTPPENLNLIDLDQLSKINEFKKELTSKGVLYKEFNTTKKFESLFRINLTNLIIEKILGAKDFKNIVQKNSKSDDKYESITSLISEVENKDQNLVDIDIFQLVEETTSYLNSVTYSLSSMTTSLNDLANNLSVRTNELNRFIKIKDNRLRFNKVKTIVNLLAKELDEFNHRIQNEIPNFSENLISVGNTYSKVILAASSYDNEDTSGLRQPAIEFRDSIEEATKSCADLLREILKLPPVNSKFNRSKRETEITLKNLTREMLDGLLLLNEAFKTEPNKK